MTTKRQGQWRTSSFSANGADCVEVRDNDDAIEMRDTKDRAGPILGLTRTQMRDLVHAIKAGKLDDLA